jgi:hypothetical protein
MCLSQSSDVQRLTTSRTHFSVELPPAHTLAAFFDEFDGGSGHKGFVKLLRLRHASGKRVPLPGPAHPLGVTACKQRHPDWCKPRHNFVGLGHSR